MVEKPTNLIVGMVTLWVKFLSYSAMDNHHEMDWSFLCFIPSI